MGLILSVLLCQTTMAQLGTTRIRHMVVFKLKHSEGSAEEQNFLNAIRKLAAIPGVEKFECMRQISKKNKFDFGLSMEFANQQAYDQYNNHPDHVAFVQNRWLKEVDDFLEIDFRQLE
jgi:quinol monooxygenase YgiN